MRRTSARSDVGVEAATAGFLDTVLRPAIALTLGEPPVFYDGYSLHNSGRLRLSNSELEMALRFAIEESEVLVAFVSPGYLTSEWCRFECGTMASKKLRLDRIEFANMSKPSIFVGSSSEGLEFARAIRALLSDVAEVTLWNEGFFRPGNTFIDTLVNALPRFDFAALVLTADDLIRSRDLQSMGPRDNVLFELGLFMGRLGRARTFLVHQSNADLKIPSDLSGVTAAEYQWPRTDDENYRAAMGAACDSIREVIRDLGVAESKTAKAITALSSKQRQQQRQLSEHKGAIRSLQFALQGIVTRYELDKLRGLVADAPFMCVYSDAMSNELWRLRALGLVGNHGNTGLRTMLAEFRHSEVQFDLKRFFFITDQGREYLQLRDELAKDEQE